MANIVFEKIKIHNFLSFGDAELDFRDKGYALVSGINKNPKDGAVSNGSGKSSIWSAISWVLTGETIQGLSSNICNLNFLDEGCWVELIFKAAESEYKIIRYRDFGKKGSDLKIFVNGEDKSGDGIRKSEMILSQYIPDLTSALIGSVIILGQGLPHRFTNNTPSGRKEVLEKLSKSDFMIEDIKARISKRSSELLTVKRTLEDDLLKTNTEITMYSNEITKEQEKLLSYLVVHDFDYDINTKQLRVDEISLVSSDINTQLMTVNNEMESTNNAIVEIVNNKATETATLMNDYNNKISETRVALTQLNGEWNRIRDEIIKLESIKDVCPTCGQKIPNVCKHDTTGLKSTLETIIGLQDHQKIKYDEITKTHNSSLAELNKQYADEELALRATLHNLKTKSGTLSSELALLTTEKNTLTAEILQIKNNKNNFEINKKQIENKIASLQASLTLVQDKILYINKEGDILNSHIQAIDKMNSLVKRDFRGFLLTHVIEFINAKAKEYCSFVFETNDIEFKLDGNNIDIIFCKKMYENLSGGEKQKVDLIIQFSIRDMLCQYLNFSSNILVLDEITDNLDSMGSDKIINLISNKLTDVESVFIITHHTELLKGLFEREIVVEKDEGGISRIK